MALPYRSVRDLYEAIAPEGVDLPTWSQQMNERSGTELYSAGLSDNLIKRFSVGLDQLLESTGLPEITEGFGQEFGQMFGNPEVGGAIGHGIPRGAVNFAPMLAGGRLGAGLSGLLAGAQAYTDTGSVAQGVVSGIANAAMPSVANLAEQLALKGLGGRLVSGPLANEATGAISQVSRLFPRNLTQGILSQGAGQGAASVFGELSSMLGSGLDPNSEYDFSPSAIALNATLGQLPFAWIYGTTKGREALGGRTTARVADALETSIQKTQENIDLRAAKEAREAKTGIESIPPALERKPLTPEVSAEIDATLARLRGEQRTVLNDPNLTDEQKLERLAPLVQQDAETAALRGEAQPDNIFGAQPTVATRRTPVTGRELRNDSKSRTVLVSPAESNPPELRGRVINYSKGLFETAPDPLGDMPGFATFHLPESWYTVLPDRPQAGVKADGTPDLPSQPNPRTDFTFDVERALAEVDAEFEAAKTPAELQSALIKLRAAQEAAGFSLTDDVRLNKRMRELETAGVKRSELAKRALLAESRKASRLNTSLRNYEARLQDIRLGDEFRAEQETKANEGFEAELQDELNQLHALEEVVQSNRTTHADALLSGDLNRMYRDWAEGGRKGGFESLVGRVMDSLRTGKDLIKGTPPKVPEVVTKLGDSVAERPITDELIERVRAFFDDPVGDQAFFSWPRRSEGYTLTGEKALFTAMMDQHALGKKDAMEEVLMDREGLSPEEASDEATHYMQRPHVQEWVKKLGEAALENTQRLPSFVPGRLKAGGPFVWGLEFYDPTTNKLGKHTLPKNGVLRVSQFKNMAGRGKPLSDDEIRLAATIVPEAFGFDEINQPEQLEGKLKRVVGQGDQTGIWQRLPDTVNVRELYKGLKEKGPTVEVKKLGGTKQSTEKEQQVAAAQHLLDTAGYKLEKDPFTEEPLLFKGEEDVEFEDAPQDVQDAAKLIAEYELSDSAREEYGLPAQGDRPRYSFLGPKSESEMPGYVEGLIRVPKATKALSDKFPAWSEQAKSERNVLLERQWKTNFTPEERSRLDYMNEWESNSNRVENPKYSGPHFGSEDTNVLAFFRGYEETLPNGKKAFHVIEVQSDWGQTVRKAKDLVKENKAVNEEQSDFFKQQAGKDHPLLAVYETLALKAAIDHARSIGADSIVLSDAETAMMTEGHDKASTAGWLVNGEDGVALTDTFESKQEAEDWVKENGKGTIKLVEPSQSGGMRLHYDTTLPSAMRKLTGQQGERVEMGTHKSTENVGAMRAENNDTYLSLIDARNEGRITEEEYSQRTAALREQKGPDIIGSPVFRNADGTPKSSITGTAYDLTSAFRNLDAQDGFTVADPSRAPRWVPESLEDQRIVDAIKPERGGHGLREWLERSSDPVIKALAKDLKKFKESLSRVSVELADIAFEGDAQSNAIRNAKIRLNPNIFHTDQARAEVVVAHELLHGLSLAELDNPTNSKIVKELDTFRNRLAQNLPKDLKARYDAAVKSDWISRYDGSNEMLQDLGSNWHDQQIVYGLLNNKELISQGFTAPEMRQFMQGLKAEGGGWYNRFKNFVKRLVGIDEKQTAYDEFLSRSDALLQQGEWVSGFQNYAERYYEGLGLPQSVARSQATRALRLVMDSANGTSPELLLRSLDVPGLLKSTEMNRAEVGLRMMKEEDQQQLMSVMDEQGLTSDRSGLDELVQEVAAGRIDPEVFDLLPPAAAKYVFAKSNDMGEVLGSLQGALSEKNNGLINLAQPQMLRGPVREANKMLDRIASSERMSDEMVGRLAGLFAVSPDGFADLNSSKAPAWLQDTVEDVKDGAAGFGSWVKNFLQPTAQRARENPETAEAYTRGYQLQANVRKMATSALKIFGIDLTDPNGNVTAESTKQSANTLKNPRLERAVDNWIYLNQLEGRKTKSIQMLSPDHPEVKKLLSKFSFDEQKDIGQMVIKQVGSTEALNGMELQSMLDIAAARGAAIANVDNGLKTSQNIKLVSEMLRSMMDLNDPMKAPVAQQQLASLATRFADPQTFSDLLRFSENEIQAYRAWEELFKKNPAYANAQRQGKYLVDYTKNGKEMVGQAQSKAQGRLYVRERGGTNPRFRLNEKGTGYDLGTDASALIQRIKQLEENRIDILRSKGVPSDVLDAVRDAGIGTQLATEAANRGGIPSADARERRLTKGAEDLPYLENHFGHVFRRANYWSRQLFRAQMDAHVLEKEIADRPDLQAQLKTHRDNMLQTDSPTAQKINRFMSTWFLGFNPASALVNTLQPFTTHVAEFTSMTGKPLDSYKRVMRALDELAGGKSARTEEHNWLEKQAAQDGEVDLQMYDTDVATSDLVATNFMRLINSNRPQTIGQRLGSLAGNVQTAAFKMFRMTEKMNNLSALFASYDYYREQGLSREAARDKAYEFNHAVNFGGGRAQRPVGAFSGRSPVLRSAAMLGTALQSYVLGTTFQLARYLNKGLFRPAGTTPAETYAARKAVAQMLGTQLAAAGTLGLPFVSGAIALLDIAFPGLELNRNIRELMSSFFQEDEENGGTFTDIAMTGVPSMLGWDLQSRLSMGNTVPGVSEINGFQPELMAGPVASLASSFVNGGRKVLTGDPSGASSLTPPGVRKILELIKDSGQVRDYRDRPLFSPSPGEVMGLALGFQPKRLSDLNAANRMLQQSEEVANRRESQWKQQQAEELLKGNFGTVRQAILERAATDKSYNRVDAARRVVASAEELAFPRDLRREGQSNVGSVRSSILRSFGVSASAPSETDRLKFRLGMEQRLGVPPSDRSAEAQLAQVMDSLPADLTRSERRRRAMILLRGQRAQPTLSLPQA